MIENPVKSAIADGGKALGTFVFEFNTNGIGRIVAAAGASFVIYDMEHTGWSIETINRLVSSTPRHEVAPFVRVPATRSHFVAHVLDAGAMGVMIPMCNDAEQARQLVQYAKYPPVGSRGAAFGIAHDDYRVDDVPAQMKLSNDEQLLIAQIETRTGLENVEEIAAVDGIDVLWIGQTDLTSSLGIPFQFDHPDYHSAIDRVVKACEDNGKTAGFMPLRMTEAEDMLSRGFRILAYSGDIWIYQQALTKSLRQLNEAASSQV